MKTKLSKRGQQIVDRINQGWKLITWSETQETKAGALIESPDGEKDHIQLAMFWKLVNQDVFYQEGEWPFDFLLDSNYKI